MPLPSLTPEQRADALLKAAAVRAARAEVKKRLKRGTMTLADVIRQGETDDTIGKLKVHAVLQAMPGMGKVRAAQMMARHGIAETRRIKGLGDRQREALEHEFAPLGM
jgi:signal recognition particle GTPase